MKQGWINSAICFLLILLLVAGSVASCGKKGPLVPPRAAQVPAVESLSCEASGGTVLLSWRIESEKNIAELYGFSISRAGPVDTGCPFCPLEFHKVADVVAGAVLKNDKTYSFADSPPGPGVYSYRVTPVAISGNAAGGRAECRVKIAGHE